MSLPAQDAVVVSMAQSVDGKIATAYGEQARLGGQADLAHMQQMRSWADAIIVGAATVRALDPPMGIFDVEERARRLREGRTPQPCVVVLSSRGSHMLPTWRAWQRIAQQPQPWLVVAQAPESALPLAELVRLPQAAGNAFDTHAIDVVALCALLRVRGMRRILVEGGAHTAWAFFRAGVVDELCVTYVPRIVGGTSALSLLAGPGFALADTPQLRLVSAAARGNELHTRWQIVRSQ